jgi:carbon monoxide dehydrogenase subunit G
MKLEKEFTVAAPLSRAWQTLTDVNAIVSCLPGQELRPVDGVHIGRVELIDAGRKLSCEAMVRSIDQDDDEHVATIALRARQLGGPAVGSVTMQGRLAADDGRTRVALSADVLSAGHEPNGAFDGAARGLFEEVAERLEQRLMAPPAHPPSPPAHPPSPRDAAAATPERASAARHAPDARLIAAGGLVLAAAVLGRVLARRRR